MAYRKKLNEEQEEEIKKRYEEGESMYKLSIYYNVSVPTIKKVLNRKNIKVKNKNEKLAERNEKIIKKIVEKLKENPFVTQKRLARELKMSEITLRKYIKIIKTQNLCYVPTHSELLRKVFEMLRG